MTKFVHLHTHSHYSLLDGLTKIDEMVARAKELEMDAIALTDHGSMYGVIEFYQKAKKAGIKPIIGCEMYITDNMYNKQQDANGRAYYHLILLAKDNIGYKNLIKLVTASNLEGFYYKPRIDKNLLRKHSEGLIGLSACLAGEISRALMGSNPDKAEKLAYEYQDIFGKGNYFIEIQQHKHIDDQNICTPKLIELARKTGIPMVATQDSHYCKPEDNGVHDVLLAVQTGNQVGDKDRLSLIHDNFSITSGDYMAEMFPDVPEALENTVKIAEMCNVEIEFGKHKLPIYPIPEGFVDDNAYLRHLCEKGFPERYGDNITDEMRQRLDYEFGVISKMGFASYFLIVQDYVNWAKNNGVITGPGRGSAAGSLIAYLLRITNIDPIKYNLLFERFLNPERVSMPDIDVDFDDARRGDVFDYVRQKYGTDHFAQVITFGTMAARGSVRDAGRALGYPYELCDKISKLIPMNPNQGKKKGALEAAVEEVPDLKQLYQLNPDVKKIVDVAKRLEGVARHCSTHACAVVIAPQPLTEFLPLQRGTNEGDIITQYEMHAVEDIGLLKMDFLGLSNLTIIEKTLNLITKNIGVSLNLDKIPLTDDKTFRLLQSAHTTGVFQLESSGMKRYLKALKPTSVDDLIVMVSLYRPGPLDAGMVEEYIERKHGRKPVTYLHPQMEPILAGTYGIIVYQEQLMSIANNLGKFTLGQGYMLIKAVGKKIKALLDEQKSRLVDGMVGNNIEKQTAEKIWDFIEPFARYGFNKCLTGDTDIYDYNSGGTVKLIDIINGTKKVSSVLSIDQNYKLIPQNIKAIHRNGLKKIYKLTTRSGRAIRATSNHPFFGVDGWINLEKLKAGDQIAVPRILHSDVIKRELKNHELATLGYLIAEGNLCHPHGVYYYSKDEAEHIDYIFYAEQFSNTRTVLSHSKSVASIYSKRIDIKKKSELVGFIEELGLKNKKATEKFIPDIIFKSPNSDIALFFAKLFQGDGHISIKGTDVQLFYATSSKLLSIHVQTILLRFGIISSIHTKKFKYRNTIKYGWTVHVSRWDNIKLFIENFGEHLIGKKKEVCNLIIKNHPVINQAIKNNSARGTKDIIPAKIITDLLNDAIKKQGMSKVQLANDLNIAPRLLFQDKKKVGYMRETVALIAEKLDNSELTNIARSDIYWDQVKSIEEDGYEETYDLEIDGIHNFVANNIIVHNSHAACYAMIGYQTAYLKANYPIEFMAALLNSSSDDIERIAFLIEECRSMNIEVLAPHINESEKDFAVVLKGENRGKIRFGMAAIKNVGENIVQEIIKEREANGKFEKMEDLLSRVHSKDLNKKSLESLIRAGALEIFGERGQLLGNLENFLEFARQQNKNASTKQISLFDIGGSGAVEVPALKLIDFEPTRRYDKLMWEKELLGLFISDHPLKDYMSRITDNDLMTIKDVIVSKRRTNVKIAGMVIKTQKIVTKTGKNMAFSTIEDMTSKLELVIFPSVYEQFPSAFEENCVLIATGKIDASGEKPKMLCDNVRIVNTLV